MVGRFLQEDTYRGDGLNLYAYCANNPVIYYDPSGHIEVGYVANGSNDPGTTQAGQVGQSIQISDQKMYQVGSHYNKHGVEMGYSSKKEYEQAARNFFKENVNKAEIFEGTFNGNHGQNVGKTQIIVRYDGKQLIIGKESGQIIDFYEGTSLSSFINVERKQ